MRRANVSIAVVALLIASSSVFLSCDKEKRLISPDQEEQESVYSGWLYVTQDFKPGLFKIDTETGDAVDSLDTPTRAFLVDASQDGKYVATSHFSGGTLLDYSGFTAIRSSADLSELFSIPLLLTPVFVSDYGIMLGFSDYNVYTYSIPDFQVSSVDSIGRTGEHLLFEPDTLVYCLLIYGSGTTDSVTLAAYNFVRREIVDQWDICGPVGDLSCMIAAFDISPDGKHLFIAGHAGIICYDLRTRTVDWQFDVAGSFVDVVSSPDGDRIYALNGGFWSTPPHNGFIVVLNASDGSHIAAESFDDIRGEYLLQATSLRMTPDGKNIFVAGASQAIPFGCPGSVLVFDTEENHVKHVTWPELDHVPLFMAIGPK